MSRMETPLAPGGPHELSSLDRPRSRTRPTRRGVREDRPAPAVDLEEWNRQLQAELEELRREQEGFRQALFSAAQVQRRLCALREWRRGSFEIASEIFPVRYLSGDFSTLLPLGESLGLAIGDIVGKGLAAGLWFTHLVGLVRVHAASLADPAAAAAAMNRDLCQLQPDPPLTGLFLGRLDLDRGEFLYTNAGLPPALLLRSGGGVEALEEGGPLLGAVPEGVFRTGRVRLEPGDTLIGYSDGIVECRNGRGEEFGQNRLLAAAGGAAGSSAGTLLFSLLGAVQDFAGSRPPDDDFTLLVVRRRGRERARVAA